MRSDTKAFADDYYRMRDLGLNHDDIAALLGVARESVLRRIARNGIEYRPESWEIPIRTVLDRLIASGEEFTAADLPSGVRPGGIQSVVMAYVGQGRIVSVGTRYVRSMHSHSHRTIYRSANIVAAEQVSA